MYLVHEWTNFMCVRSLSFRPNIFSQPSWEHLKRPGEMWIDLMWRISTDSRENPSWFMQPIQRHFREFEVLGGVLDGSAKVLYLVTMCIKWTYSSPFSALQTWPRSPIWMLEVDRRLESFLGVLAPWLNRPSEWDITGLFAKSIFWLLPLAHGVVA